MYNILVFISYQWPENGFDIFSIEGVRALRYLTVFSNAIYFIYNHTHQ